MKKESLNGKWTGSYVLAEASPVGFDGQVPGCAHTDLLRCGLLPDYKKGYAVEECRFVERARFTYERDFDFQGEAEGVQLVFTVPVCRNSSVFSAEVRQHSSLAS